MNNLELQWLHDTANHSSDCIFFLEWIPAMINFGKKNDFDLSVFSEFKSNPMVGDLIGANIP